MGVTQELLDTIRKLSALEQRTDDVTKNLNRIEDKIDDFIDRLSRIESNYSHLRQNVKNEILADIKADLASVQTYMDIQQRFPNLLNENNKPED